jgi:hypothetical protein
VFVLVGLVDGAYGIGEERVLACSMWLPRIRKLYLFYKLYWPSERPLVFIIYPVTRRTEA